MHHPEKRRQWRKRGRPVHQMRRVLEGDRADVCSREFVCEIHEAFYDRLPPHHQFTHGPQGFTRFTVNPGLFRDVDAYVQDPIVPD